MPVEVFEKFESRRSTKANQVSQSSAELGYIVRGTADDLVARNAAQTASPATYDSLARQNVQIEPLGPQLWDVTVRYGSSDSGGNPTPSEASFNFETGGGTQHITQSKDTVQARAASGSTAPDFGGAIGVTADGVDGVDTMHDGRDDWPGDLVDELAEDRVFLRRPADDGKGPDRAFFSRQNALHTQYREIVFQAVITEVVAEWSLG